MVHGVYHSKALSTSGCWKTSKDKYSNREPITMFLTELAEPTLLVIYPGRFQPFHKGHYAVYEYLTGKFGRNNVYIATSNKTDNAKSPFTFAEKAYFMQLTGVPADRIVQATQPYQIQNVLQSGNINVANPANTVVIFAVSEKDMAEDPRFSFAPKKDGSAPYFQPLRDIKQTESMDKHGYIMTVPTFDFTVAGQPMRSGTELRKLYSTADQQERQEIIKDLFGKYTTEAEQIMNNKIPAEQAEPVAEAISQFVPAQKTSQDGYYKLLAYRYRQNPGLLSAKEKQELHDYIQNLKTVKESGGTGVVASKKQANDPRYSTSLTKDVRPGQINKSLKAFNLAEQEREPYQQAVDRLTQHEIDHLSSLIDEIKQRITTEKLPAKYVEALKQRIEKLQAERAKLAFNP